MKINTVKGTNDYLPEEMRLRDYLQDVILKTYQSCGFVRISTPILEDAENLDKSDGGENLNLIFKVLKRGEKLEKALAAGDEAGLADLGLRYDLTLPLSRYYANNRAKLLTPFKCIQMDRVYRAERPQKGRLREFVQCDIDIIGDSSVCAELQLMTTTAEALRRIGMTDFKMKVNDRRILRAVLLACGFAEETLDGVCIGLDKLDKIGSDGVAKELEEKGYPAEAIEKLGNILSDMPVSIERVKEILKGNWGWERSRSERSEILDAEETMDFFDGTEEASENTEKRNPPIYSVEEIMELTGANEQIERLESEKAAGLDESSDSKNSLKKAANSTTELGFGQEERKIKNADTAESGMEKELEPWQEEGIRAAESLESLLSMMRELSDGRYDVVFDLSLVRGQGYYTGTVFEVESSRFKGAIAGGGRYDNLIGKFLGENVPAVGFSIGFERIFSILMETGAEIPDRRQRVAVLCWEDQCMEAMKQAAVLREQYDTDVFIKPKKVGKFIDRLKTQGYDAIWQVGQSEEIKMI